MFRLIDTQGNNGAMNMAIDEALLIAQAKYGSSPVLRVYKFVPPTLSIGYFQSAEKEVDFEALKRKGYDFVRRPTGGRAVLHDKELTYSVTIAYPNKILEMNLLESFHFISRSIIKAIEYLGGVAYFSEREEKEISSPSCFAAPTFSDILMNGRKVVGSAQMRNKFGLLQHGSILYEVNVEDIFDCFKLSKEEKEKMIKIGKEKISSISQELGRSIGFDDIKESFIKGFSEVMGEELVESKLSSLEIDIAYDLYKNKYNTKEWNFRKWGENMGRQSKIRQLRREGKLPKVQHEHKTPKWVKVLIPIIIVLIVFGIVSSVWGYVERDMAAKVGKETITVSQVNNQLDYYKNLYSQFGMTLTSTQEQDLKNNILQNLIEESLLVQYAKDHNLKVDETQYKKNLEDQINSYIDQQKKQIGEKNFNDYVTAQYGSLDEFKKYLEKVFGPYVERPLLADAALNEQYKIISVTDEEIKNYFNSVKEISAEHLLVMLPDNPSKSDIDKAKTLADQIYNEIKQKEASDKNFNFATYAQNKVKEINDKEGKTVLKYENLGYFGKGAMVKEFEDAVFDPNVKVNDIIGPVKTQYGYHIIHILGKKTVQETYNQPEKVNVRMVQFNFDPKDKKSKDNAYTSARSISIQTRNGMSFIEAVQRFSQDETTKKNNGETGFFSRDERPQIFDAAIKLKKGGISDPIELSNAYVVIQLIDVQPAKTATLSDKDIYNKVKDELINNKKAEIKKEFIAKLEKQYGVRKTNPGRVIANFFRTYIATPFNKFQNWVSSVSKPQTTTNTNTNNQTTTEPLQPVNPSSGS